MDTSNEHFKILRRNSLKLEVDGAFDELENFEDRNEVNNKVTSSECLLLLRALGDKSKLPKCCRPAGGTTNLSMNTTSSNNSNHGAAADGLSTLARRLSGAVPGAFDDKIGSERRSLGGAVGIADCQALRSHLASSIGGLYLLPGACTRLLKLADQAEAEQFERENAAVYKRLQRRQTEVAKAGFPPTAC